MTPTNSNYPKYGGRGIKVCDRWVASFENFLADMGERPAGRTLDRIDNDGPYSPENCRWATKREQQNNMRTNRLIRVGSEMMTLSNAARAMGMREGVLRSRLWLGWSEDRALNQPVQRRYRSLPVDPTP